MSTCMHTSVVNWFSMFPDVSLVIPSYGANLDWTGDDTLQAQAVGSQAATVKQLLGDHPGEGSGTGRFMPHACMLSAHLHYTCSMGTAGEEVCATDVKSDSNTQAMRIVRHR